MHNLISLPGTTDDDDDDDANDQPCAAGAFDGAVRYDDEQGSQAGSNEMRCERSSKLRGSTTGGEGFVKKGGGRVDLCMHAKMG